MAWDFANGVELAKVYKTKATFIALTLVKDGQKQAIDVREKFDKVDGTTQHTTRGFMVPVDKIEEFAAAMKDVLAAVQ